MSAERYSRFNSYATVGLLVVQAALLARGAYVHSPTLNEPGHLVAGISNWQFGRFDVYKVNPPVVRMVAAVPVLLVGAKTDWRSYYEGVGARPEFSLGEEFVAANGERSFWLFTLARWACIPMSLLGGYACFRWARELYGDQAGVLSLTLWCFCPNILGHGALITSDAAAAALGLAACYTFWRWLRRPTWSHTLLSGAILGLAELAKTTLVIFYPLWFVMWGVYRWNALTLGPSPIRGEGGKRILRELGMLVMRTVVAIYVVNLGYGFEGSGMRLGEFRFVSATLGAESGEDKAPAAGGNRFANSWMAMLPVMLPKNYVLGIDLQRKDFEDYTSPSYLRGEFREKGWWYYYLYALAIKVPLGTWVLLGLAATRGIWLGTPSPSVPLPSREREGITGQETAADGTSQVPDVSAALSHGTTQRVPAVPATLKATWRDEFILLAPAIIILVFVSSQTGFSEHMRYVLPIFPFFFVWIGRVAVVFDPSPARDPEGCPAGPTSKGPTRQRIFGGLIIASLGWSIISSLSVYPHSLSYFNELVGGPTGGPKHLIHSNVDWGQDLLFLKKWIDKHPEAKPLKLAYFGYFDPQYAGIEYSAPEVPAVREGEDPMDAPIPPGWYAVSVNFVRGLPYFSYKGDGTKVSYGLKELARFQRLKPTAMAGYSIYIYHVE
jgi:hypothetical protein